MKYNIICLFNVLLTTFIYAQEKECTLSGVIIDADCKTLPNVSIVIATLGHSSKSDHTGKFSIAGLPQGKHVVVLSHVGYIPEERTITIESTPIDLGTIVMKKTNYAIKQVDVLGEIYATTPAGALNKELVDQQYIHRHLGGSLMQTLSRLPGISNIGIGSGQSKPLIRGLGFNRVVVVEKGVKHEGQQWGADHGLEIDQFAAGNIEVIKGAASFLYGSDAIGGVIDIKPEPLSEKESLSGSLNLIGKSNNDLYGVSANAQGRTENWIYGGRVTYQRYGDYRVPTDTVHVYDYPVRLHKNKARNTAGKELNFHFNGGYATENFETIFYISNNSNRSGFFANAHGLEPRRVDTELHDTSSRDMQMPYQQVNHFKVINRSSLTIGFHCIEMEAGFQHNFRQEYSKYVNHGYMPPVYPDSMKMPSDLERQYDKRVYSLNLRDRFSIGQHTFVAGINGEYQHNRIDGWSFLIPGFNQLSAGAFLYDRYRLSDKVSLYGALRYDYSHIETIKYTDWFPSVVSEENGNSETAYLTRAANLQRTFNSLVWSSGATYNEGDFSMKANVGKSFRVPIAKELAANGVNYHYFSYELGDPALSPEQSYQFDAGLSYSKEKLSLELNPFYNYFSNYIYLNPTPRHDHFYGAGNQIFEYTQSRVQRYGGEIKIGYRFSEVFRTELLAEYVKAEQLSGSKKGYPLPFSPPASFLANMSWQPNTGSLKNSYFSVDLRLVAPQNEIVPPEKKTPGYELVNVQVGHPLMIYGKPIQINLQVQNLFDTKYLDHTSFYRLIEMPEVGRNIVLSLSVPFDFSRKRKS
ncbi:TonB-dependent receptor [Sphingobacterium corticibacterium]|uniref:TonB-dependent receptor n=1 Tax=Sphingobacterium corticibacterium TaxID=2484746 RepID=A0A4Q6XF29_9SPHI|nr:TonB-dependent receptor [Sphingobacterium corticibacterium]RZF58013.1 TonB-dependent receptor [Sphingobacterium corticibacterium]